MINIFYFHHSPKKSQRDMYNFRKDVWNTNDDLATELALIPHRPRRRGLVNRGMWENLRSNLLQGVLKKGIFFIKIAKISHFTYFSQNLFSCWKFTFVSYSSRESYEGTKLTSISFYGKFVGENDVGTVAKNTKITRKTTNSIERKFH